MKKRSGFTLIELLVVIAIIAVLMSVLMPSLQRVRNQAKGVMCQTHLREWGLIWTMHLSENQDKFANYQAHDWMDEMKPLYADQNDILFCPSTDKDNFPGSKPDQIRYSVIVRNVGGITRPVASYSLNEWILDSDHTGSGRALRDYWRNTQHPGLNNIPVMGDGVWRSDAQPNLSDDPPEFEGQPRAGVNNGEIRLFTIPRHRNGMHMLFMDWSVRHVGMKGLWRLKWKQTSNLNHPLPVWPDWMSGFSDK